MLELRANPKGRAIGRIIEAQVTKGTGNSCSVVLLDGSLKVGDHVVCGTTYGKVRAIRDEYGN